MLMRYDLDSSKFITHVAGYSYDFAEDGKSS
jgi:hypothetical protein